MSAPKKLTHSEKQSEQEAVVGQETAQTQTAREFASVEALLQHDAKETAVPASIAQRLQETVRQLPPPVRQQWWRRFFGP